MPLFTQTKKEDGHRTRSMPKFTAGFTLIEMMVATSIFIMVMVVAAGAILSIVDGNRKAQSAKIAIDNLSFALENMSRHIRVGTSYSCSANPLSRTDCSSGSAGGTFSFLFKDPALPLSNPPYPISYTLSGGAVQVTDNGVTGTLTSPDITIRNMTFYVDGANSSNDGKQPRVIIVIEGLSGGANVKEQTEFSLQTSVTQRILDHG